MNGTGVDPFVVETESIDNLTVVVQVSHTLSPTVVHVTSCDSMPVSCPIPIPSHDTISYHCHSLFPCHLVSSHTHPPPPHRCVHQEMDLQSVEEEDVKSVRGVDHGVTPCSSLLCSPHHHVCYLAESAVQLQQYNDHINILQCGDDKAMLFSKLRCKSPTIASVSLIN